jgi:hypothetical protein
MEKLQTVWLEAEPVAVGADAIGQIFLSLRLESRIVNALCGVDGDEQINNTGSQVRPALP